MVQVIFLLVGLMWEYKSPRSLGMGGISTALRDPTTAFFMNPAGLMGVRSLDIIDIEFFASEALISEFSQAIKILEKAGEERNEEFIKRIRDSFGKVYSFDLFSFPHFTLDIGKVAFGMGILFHGGSSANPALPSNLTLRYTGFVLDIQPVIGTAAEVIGETLKIGFSVTPFKIAQNSQVDVRENEFFGKGLSESFPGIDRAINNRSGFINDVFRGSCKSPFNCAFGFGGANVGLIFEPIEKKISFGLDVRDIFDPIEKTTVDIGFTYFDRLPFFRYGFGLDFQDLIFVKSEDKSFFKRLHFGSEISVDRPFSRFLSFMFGVGQMQFSFAVEMNLKVFSLVLGTYGQEFGRDVGITPVRYYFFKLSI